MRIFASNFENVKKNPPKLEKFMSGIFVVKKVLSYYVIKEEEIPTKIR